MEEIWRPIIEFPTFQISNLGRVRTRSISLISQCIANKRVKTSYYRVKLSDGKLHLVHRLVANAFIQNLNNKPQVNHKDGNPLNNNAINLEWVTPSENGMHASRMGLLNPCRGSDQGNSRLTENDIIKIRELYPSIKSQRKLAKMFSVSQRHIGRILNFDRWAHI